MQLIKALICQTLACVVVLLLSGWLSLWSFDIRFIALIQSVIAATLSGMLRQPVWWWFIHLFFMPVVAIMLVLSLPPWLYLLAFLLLTLVFWGTVKGDVPLFLSSSAVSEALTAILAREHAKSFADLGAGVGTVVVPLSRQLPEVRIDALERAPLPWLLTYWRCRDLQNVRVRRRSLWHSNLGEYEVVFAYLSPSVMARVGEKVRLGMREGSLFISSSFPVPDWLPEAVQELDDRQKTRLYCYRIPPKTFRHGKHLPR